MKLIAVVAMVMTIAATAQSQEQAGRKGVDSAQLVLDGAVAEARAALNRYGEADSAMMTIERALSKVAALRGLRARATLKAIHGAKNMGRALLASEKDSGICLYLSWFGKGAATPVHDHLTWGVLRVLEGNDRHVRWKRRAADQSSASTVEKTEDRVLGAGESIWWLGPPNDMHSQEAVGDTDVWELVMTGRDLASDYVVKNQRRFDRTTGQAIPKEQKL